jgi:SAM-dependent methyltransferase
LIVLDPACGGGALLAAAGQLASGLGARLQLHGLDLSPLAASAARGRLELLGADAEVLEGDALAAPWPACHLLLANPPFLRHEAIPPRQKAVAARASGLSRQADLSAHLALLALRRAPVAALVLPRALLTARSAEPLLAEARARGGFALRLRSRAAGSFAASVDTLLAVWVAGGRDEPAAEAAVPLRALGDADLRALARGRATPRVRLERGGQAPRQGALGVAAVRLDAVCQVRFGLKTGCNAFFHLLPLGPGRFRSALLGEVTLEAGDTAPLLASLKEARAPERLEPVLALFRPAGRPSAAARRYLQAGERAGVHRRPTCAGREPWWGIVPGRAPAPLLYPAKLGARAFAVINEGGLLEDKKWHALFPRQGPAWPLALVLSATPVRLAIDEQARQLTGAQAIADVDCRVLAAAPVPAPAALAALHRELAPLRRALAHDEVTTDLEAMLDRPAQRELDLLVGRALGLGAGAVRCCRAALLARVRARLDHAAAVRGLLAGVAVD